MPLNISTKVKDNENAPTQKELFECPTPGTQPTPQARVGENRGLDYTVIVLEGYISIQINNRRTCLSIGYRVPERGPRGERT